MAMEDSPLVMVEDADALAKMCERLKARSVIGVDTESDSMHHFQEKVCLIQISDVDTDYIVDPLSVKDLSPLGEIINDPKVLKVLHGADYDIVSLKRDYGFTFRNLFDTMIAAQFLGFVKFGLADLVRDTFGVFMDKKFQTHDWASRPLLGEHLEYARGDTHFLIALHELMRAKLDRKGRLKMVEEECRILAEREWRSRAADTESWTRVKGANRLNASGQRVLRALCNLRDMRAKEMDRPPYKVFPDQILLRLAELQPTDFDTVASLVKPRSPLMRRHGEDMLAAVQEGLNDESSLPEPRSNKPRKAGPPTRYGMRETERLMLRLKDWRAAVKKRTKVPMIMVASNNQLKALAGWRPHTTEELFQVEDLREWQIKLYGPELLELVRVFEASLEPAPRAASASAGGGGEASGRRKRRRRRGPKGGEASGGGAEASGGAE